MASLSDSYSRGGDSSLMSRSFSAVESFLSQDSSISSSSASSSSTSTIASSSSSTSTLTPPQSPSGEGVPLWQTLVRPRPWRFVQRSRVGGSLDRDKARQEDTSLDGDDFRDNDSETSSCLDSDVFPGSDGTSHSSLRAVNGVSSSVDTVNRAKSESDIAIRKCTGSGERGPLGFKTRAERFSLPGSKDSQPRGSSMTRSQTLPPSGRSTLSPAKSQTLPRGPALVDATRRSRSSSRMDVPKTVKFSEPESVELSPAKSDSSSGKSSDKSLDSPSRNISLNVQDTSARVSFSKPVMSTKLVTLEKTSDTSGKTKSSLEKPDVPTKPARLNVTANGPTSLGKPATSSTTTKPTLTPATSVSTKERTQTSPSGGTSPKSPVNDELFIENFVAVNEVLKDTDLTVYKPLIGQEDKLKIVVSESEHPLGDTTFIIHPENGIKTPEETPRLEREDTNGNLKDSLDILPANSEHSKHKGSDVETEIPLPQLSPETDAVPDISDSDKKVARPKEKEIVPKKMIKIKGDKKAEEKAAKAKKKEEKAKEKEREKELKNSKKKTSESGDHEKGRIKLFPWKVEFSANKDRSNTTTDTASSVQKSKDSKKKKETKKGKQTGRELSSASPSRAKHGGHGKDRAEGDDPKSAPAKKSDKVDGPSSSSSKKDTTTTTTTSKPSQVKKETPTPFTHPLQQEDDEDGVVQSFHEQPTVRHHPEPSRELSPPPPPPPPQRKPSSSTPPPQPPPHQHPLSPHQYHQQQFFPQQQNYQQQKQFQQFPPPRQLTPKPRYFDDVSSSDQNSDLDSWYGSLPRRGTGAGRNGRVYESDGETVPQGPLGQGGGRRKVIPRRHTVGGAQIQEHLQLLEDTDRKREAFYEMLATRYPQYADKITGLSGYPNEAVTTATVERNGRPREPQRRRTTVPAFSPYTSRSLDYDDPGTMSDVELSSFQRGGYARASMPIVRSASTSLDRPIGLVFLVYGEETKKALLPNQVTSLDTVRALFVRAFPDKLSLNYLDSPKRKIYILESATSIFFQLEDLRDIKDRTVLKIHECDSDEPQQVRFPLEVRGRAGQPVRPSTLQGLGGEGGPHFAEEMSKTQSLPTSSSQQSYQEMLHQERLQWQMEQEYLQAQLRRSRSRSLTPDPADRSRSLSAGPPRGRYSHSPDRLSAAERGPGAAPLNPIPENPRLLANGFRQAAVNGGHYPDMGGHGHHPPVAHPPPPHPGRVVSPPPVVYDVVYPPGGYHPHPQAFVSHSTRAPPLQGPQRATGPPVPPDIRGPNRGGPPHRQSLPFAAISNPVYDGVPARAPAYRVTPERDVLPPRPQSAGGAPQDINRMERMEAQIASLAAWVHQVQRSPAEVPPPQRRNSNRSTSSNQSEGTDTYPASSSSKQNGDCSLSPLPGLSDIPAVCSAPQQQQTPVVTSDMRDKINEVRCRAQELRVELQGLRRMEQLNQEAMRDTFTDTLAKLKKVISAVPGADDQVVRQQRLEVNSLAEAYREDKARVEKELSDLELSVEELKQDVLARKCRVNVSHIEALALVLSNITKALADLKGRYPKVHESMRKVMAGEMEIVVKEEKFLKEEPLQIEAALKRCKKLTSTLYTLKRLATVQDSRPPQVPSVALESREVGEEEKMTVLENIRSMIPDHETRLTSLQAADASRERKKKIVTQQESLKFTKSLQTASKALKPLETLPTTTLAENTAPSSDKESTKKWASADVTDAKKTEHPPVPAKPARLMSGGEARLSDSVPALSSSSSTPLSPVTHTVTVTSQISREEEKTEKGKEKPGVYNSAKTTISGSVESASEPDWSKATIESSPVVTMSAAATKSAGSSHTRPVSSTYQSTRRLSGSSDSSQHSEDESADRGKRVPPPPPPRTSSARYPYGIGPLSPQSPGPLSAGPISPQSPAPLSPQFPGSGEGARPSLQRQTNVERTPDTGTGLTGYKAHGHISPTTHKGPLSSTPKPPTPHKPPNLSKLQKGGGVGAVPPAGLREVKGRPNLVHQRVGAGDRMFTTFVPPVPAAVTTYSQDPVLDECDLSDSESTGSTTSLDSQQGAATLIRTNSTPPHRGPKPSPPQRCSSLKEGVSRDGEVTTVPKTDLVEVKKPLKVGSMTVQLNGMDRAESVHKT